MPRYVALLRGINVGGKNVLRMDTLRAALAAAGLANVRTLLASGNAAFDAEEAEPPILEERIEAMLLAAFGRRVPALVRTAGQVQALLDEAPFAGVEVSPQTRLYVSFLSEPPATRIAAPYRALESTLEILRITPTEACSVLTLGRAGTVDAMKVLEDLFGPRITTRNWNTVVRLASL